MGRVQTKFNLPAELNERLSREIPSGSRSKFVSDAIEAALTENARERALKQLDELPAYPVGDKSSIEVLRMLREERQQRLIGGLDDE